MWNEAGSTPGLAGGGGFSSLFARPSYQTGVVGQSQRALPDLALLADVLPGYDVYCTAQADCQGHGWLTFGGTSAATPLMAGGVALIDQLLRQHGRQPLGLLNPLLYALAAEPSQRTRVFYDVVQGSNDVGPFIQGTGGQPLGCCSAGPGFDPASGWGGIDLLDLAQAAQAMQRPVGQVMMRLPGVQDPVAARAVTTRVRCTQMCDVTVRVRMAISGGPAFTDYSSLTVLRPRAWARIRIPFTSKQLRRLGNGLGRHLRLLAHLTAALSDASGNIERQTPTVILTVRG